MRADVQALRDEASRKIDAFADHAWGEHDPRPWMLGQALSVSGGLMAIDDIERRRLPAVDDDRADDEGRS